MFCIYNEGSQPGTPYIGAKGLSVLVEVDGERTLFGTGMRERYLRHNIEHLEVDVNSITRAVISHGHKSHSGGVGYLLFEREEPFPVYAPKDAWGKNSRFSNKGIKLTKNTEPHCERFDVDGWVQLSKHLYLSPPVEADGVSEIFMVLAGGKRPILISGCCHCGVEKAIELVKEKFGEYPKSLIGGLHLENVSKDISYRTAEVLKDAECQDLHLNHCTGPKGAVRLREILSLSGVNEFIVGDKLEYRLGLVGADTK